MTWILLLRLVIDLVVLGVVILIISTVINSRNVSPPISTRKKVIASVVEALGTMPEGSVFYDLGSGTGQVLLAVAKANKNAKCIGVEKYLVPYLISKENAFRRGLKNVSVIRRDIFAQTYADATHLYTYLYPETMEAVLPYLNERLKSGTKLVSLDFPFHDKEPISKLSIPNYKPGNLGKTLFVYKF